MKAVLVIAMLGVALASQADERDLEAATKERLRVATEIPAELDIVEAIARYRFLEFRLCSPEHCWSDSYLQWLSDDASDRRVIATIRVRELGYGTAVTSARWQWSNKLPELEVRYEPSHQDGPEQTLVVVPKKPGEYVIKER